MTLWVFSPDNLLCGTQEVSASSPIELKLAALTHYPQIHSRRVRVRAIGDLALVPERNACVIERDRASHGAMRNAI